MTGLTEHITSKSLIEGAGTVLGVVGSVAITVIGLRAMYNSIFNADK